MYFPYVRGKQFELIALRDLCGLFPNDILKTSPVIEPVKSSSTLKSSLKELASKNVNFNVVINPRVGDLKNNRQVIIDVLSENLQHYTNYQLAVIIDAFSSRQLETLIAFINGLNLNFNGVTLIHNSETTTENIELLTSSLNVVYNLIYFSKTSRRYYREFGQNTRVSLDDYFKELPKNADYLDQESSFSEEYRYYQEDGFVGFGDFITIGDNYSDSGFLPRAVAIHLSYIDGTGKIKVKHFVSDSNGDTSDIGGKFVEALDKLVAWCKQQNIHTRAVEIFRDLHQRGHFPGLGILKKLSIMNHIELVITNI
ncbi:sce7725 family protein [Xanthomarina gelatinilytica]|uniref:sce7725 family protein n=1 Tax=Xanthomarina gelatinilytica TaxID=1137281 RepID=UPI003AA878FD